jgi:hypothetical protein
LSRAILHNRLNAKKSGALGDTRSGLAQASNAAKIDKWFQLLRVAEIQAKGHKAFGFVAWHGGFVGLALCLPRRCFASATASRNGLYAI